MKCPICGAELKRVPNNPKRMKCDSCRRVFDTGQLERLYGIKSGDRVHAGTMPYETRHMHEKHSQTGNAETRHTQGNTVNKNTVFVDEKLPNQTMTNWANTIRGQVQTYTQTQQNTSPVQKPAYLKLIIWLCILFFVLPFIITMCSAIVSSIDDLDGNFNININSNTASNHNTNTTTGKGGISDLEATKAKATYDVRHDDYYGDVLIAHLEWENNANYDYDVSSFLAFDVTAKNSKGKVFDTAYISDIAGVFDSDSKFDNVSKGSKGSGDWAFTINGENEVEVYITANNDIYNYSEPPFVKNTVTIKDGKVDAVKTDTTFGSKKTS